MLRKIAFSLIDYNVILIHGAAIAVDNCAYLFCAPSGTGKSTHTRYWKDVLGDRVTVINGDKPIYRFKDGKLMVFGTPWCGKENWQTNIAVPLKALCLLERGEENAVFPINASDVLSELFHHFHLPGGDQVDMLKMVELIDRMVSTVPLYRLRCCNDRTAAETAIAYFGL